jgi:hypothetical protein
MCFPLNINICFTFFHFLLTFTRLRSFHRRQIVNIFFSTKFIEVTYTIRLSNEYWSDNLNLTVWNTEYDIIHFCSSDLEHANDLWVLWRRSLCRITVNGKSSIFDLLALFVTNCVSFYLNHFRNAHNIQRQVRVRLP